MKDERKLRILLVDDDTDLLDLLKYNFQKEGFQVKAISEILFFLMQNPNKVISRKNLIKIIWGSGLFVLDSSKSHRKLTTKNRNQIY